MNVFDIIGPVMVGPSSSHTAGAVRIGRMVRALLAEEPVEAVIAFHGSFARTYKGHGTDKAIIAGLLGMLPDDLQIRDSLELAGQKGLQYRFEMLELKDAHPNTVQIETAGRTGKIVKVQGASVGGGNILIQKLNGLEVEFTGQYHTLVICHKDTPGAIAAVTNLLAYSEVNIAQMKVYRSHRGGEAMMVIETDQEIGEELRSMLGKLPKITSVTAIKPI
jgi:L-serine dehydratase